MRVLIGVENNNEGRSLAWALEHFGCIGYGDDGQSAVIAMAKAIPDYIAWMESHTSTPWFSPAEIDIRLVDVFDDYFIDRSYQVVPSEGKLIKAWFKSDWKPVTQEDIEHAIQILTWSRQDMLQLISTIPDSILDQSIPGEGMSIREIVGHVGRAEWWLMDRLGRSHTVDALDPDPIERYQKERAELLVTLPELIDLEQVVGRGGEIWSPRKVVRRLCWHERDHYQHIQKILARIGN
jgi:hypothetical protein